MDSDLNNGQNFKAYLYRALSNQDCSNLKSGKDLTAAKISPTKFFSSCMEKMVAHIAYGTKFPDTWISSGKDFFICAAEFSIPQMGGYSNSLVRRPMAIINRQKEINAQSTYDFNGINHTFLSFADTSLDLGDNQSWPDVCKQGNYFCFNGVRCYKSLSRSGLHISTDIWEKLQYINPKNIETFIFDTAPTVQRAFEKFCNKQRTSAPLHMYSLRSFMREGLIPNQVKSPHIVCSTSHANKEVLFFKKIKYTSIERSLTLEEIDFLYAFRGQAESVFNCVLSKLLSSNLSSTIIPTSLAIDSAYQSFIVSGKKGNILQIYHQCVSQRKAFIWNAVSQQLTLWGLPPFLNGITPTSTPSLDDAIIVTSVANKAQISNKQRYDVVMFEDLQGKIHYYLDSDYQTEWKKWWF